jgi:hypothetical protein
VKSYARNKKYDTTTIPAKPRYGDNGLVLTSPNTKGTHLRKNIFVLSKAGSGASTLIGGSHHGYQLLLWFNYFALDPISTANTIYPAAF